MAELALSKLKILLISTPSVSRNLIATDIGLVKGICELALNILYNEDIILIQQLKNSLKKHKSVLEKLAKPKSSLTSKQKILLKQAQKLLPILLQATLPYLNDYVKGVHFGSNNGMETIERSN
jgi:hypothetical protein